VVSTNQEDLIQVAIFFLEFFFNASEAQESIQTPLFSAFFQHFSHSLLSLFQSSF
jgi:hypothetical protein